MCRYTASLCRGLLHLWSCTLSFAFNRLHFRYSSSVLYSSKNNIFFRYFLFMSFFSFKTLLLCLHIHTTWRTADRVSRWRYVPRVFMRLSCRAHFFNFAAETIEKFRKVNAKICDAFVFVSIDFSFEHRSLISISFSIPIGFRYGNGKLSGSVKID